MDWQIIEVLGGLVVTIVVAVVTGAWWISNAIHASELRTAAHIDAVELRIEAVKDDLSNLQSEVGYIKSRLDPLKLGGFEAK
ncbi:hypothetical protein [Thioalkalivibrio sp. HK1]|uniref:hypothetical protein n=1 Tax=Thioalkalivibrio sp. HK1 TaxID=1469245 RepID=UPI0012DBE772|nr:hypothetical protein [Thioalkalivibrio sp. HK1]